MRPYPKNHLPDPELATLIEQNLPYTPNNSQKVLISGLAEFMANPVNDTVFVIKGYAGTGKTSITGALVKAADYIKLRTVLLAPTGRAAKVLSVSSGSWAATIHRFIYGIRTTAFGSVHIFLKKNIFKNTLFLVDEASMIPGQDVSDDSGVFSGRIILDDLMEYVGTGQNCKLVIIGDTAQLPPVGLTLSPALDSRYIENNYLVKVHETELREVARQGLNSGILFNASAIREKIRSNENDLPLFNTMGFKDIQRINGNEMGEKLADELSSTQLEQCVVICRSNKRANLYNREIRNRILFREDEISPGDLLMVVRNNYFWLPLTSKAGFIANGDIIRIKRIWNFEEIYGFRFADITFELIDYPEDGEIESKIILNTISLESPALSYRESRTLYEAVAEDYSDISDRTEKAEEIRKNPHLNALQVKFAFALTCHKTQGGQWNTVFIDQPYLPEGKPDVEFLRWLYTAITRATQKVFLVNFSDNFFH